MYSGLMLSIADADIIVPLIGRIALEQVSLDTLVEELKDFILQPDREGAPQSEIAAKAKLQRILMGRSQTTLGADTAWVYDELEIEGTVRESTESNSPGEVRDEPLSVRFVAGYETFGAHYV
jgi:hypothetical protein